MRVAIDFILHTLQEKIERAIQESMLYSDKQKADMLETLGQYYDYNKSQYGE